jgi:hypothetical protein
MNKALIRFSVLVILVLMVIIQLTYAAQLPQPHKGKFLKDKVLVVCTNPKGKMARIVPVKMLKRAITQLIQAGCKSYKIIRFFSIQQYLVPVGNDKAGWQLDENHINAINAWNITQGNATRSVKVAVVDTGLSPDAPVPADWNDAKAFTSFIDYMNSIGECYDTGYIDLGNYTFYTFYGPTFTPPQIGPHYRYCIDTYPYDVFGDGTPDAVIWVQTDIPIDVIGHGTFVSSMIAGTYSANGGYSVFTGSAPERFNGAVEVVPIKSDLYVIVVNDAYGCSIGSCLSYSEKYFDGGYFDNYTLQDALNYVADLGSRGIVKIVNMSFGGYADDQSELDQLCLSMIAPVVNAGVIPFAAAGNEGKNLDNYYEFPAECDGVYAVSALDVNNGITYWSNYGSAIDFSAPGEDVAGIYPSDSFISTVLKAHGETPIDSNGNYELWYSSGTSYSSPLVAGALATLMSVGKGLDDMIQYAKDLGSPGKDEYYGYGMPNIYAAITGQGGEGGEELNVTQLWTVQTGGFVYGITIDQDLVGAASETDGAYVIGSDGTPLSYVSDSNIFDSSSFNGLLGFVEYDGGAVQLYSGSWRTVSVPYGDIWSISLTDTGMLLCGTECYFTDYNGNTLWHTTLVDSWSVAPINKPAVKGSYAYVPYGYDFAHGFISVIDLSNGNVLWTSQDFGEHLYGADVCGDKLAVGTESQVLLFDISNPTSPRLINSKSGFGIAFRVAFSDDCKYLAVVDMANEKLYILDTETLDTIAVKNIGSSHPSIQQLKDLVNVRSGSEGMVTKPKVDLENTPLGLDWKGGLLVVGLYNGKVVAYGVNYQQTPTTTSPNPSPTSTPPCNCTTTVTTTTTLTTTTTITITTTITTTLTTTYTTTVTTTINNTITTTIVSTVTEVITTTIVTTITKVITYTTTLFSTIISTVTTTLANPKAVISKIPAPALLALLGGALYRRKKK